MTAGMIPCVLYALSALIERRYRKTLNCVGPSGSALGTTRSTPEPRATGPKSEIAFRQFEVGRLVLKALVCAGPPGSALGTTRSTFRDLLRTRYHLVRRHVSRRQLLAPHPDPAVESGQDRQEIGAVKYQGGVLHRCALGVAHHAAIALWKVRAVHRGQGFAPDKSGNRNPQI